MSTSSLSNLPILEETTLESTYVLVFERDNLESEHFLFSGAWGFLRNFTESAIIQI